MATHNLLIILTSPADVRILSLVTDINIVHLMIHSLVFRDLFYFAQTENFPLVIRKYLRILCNPFSSCMNLID